MTKPDAELEAREAAIAAVVADEPAPVAAAAQFKGLFQRVAANPRIVNPFAASLHAWLRRSPRNRREDRECHAGRFPVAATGADHCREA